jgi:iron complex outermembrane receptor protein
MFSQYRKTALALGVALAAGTSQIAQAQLQLEEVIVTAQRKAESLADAPLTVNVLSGEQIRAFDMFQADELSKLSAGVDIRNEGDSNTGVAVRGVGTLSRQAAPSRVGVYLDDWYGGSSTNFIFKQMFDITQVQILRGPQGTLYGQPSPTGAMIMTTGDPDLYEVSGNVTAALQDPKGYNVQGALSVPLVEGVLAARIAVLKDERENGLENIIRDLDNEYNSEGYRAKLLWQPSATFSAKIGWTHVESEDFETYRPVESISPLANYQLTPDDRISIQDSPDQIDEAENDLYTLHVDWDAGPVEVQLFAARHDFFDNSDSDNDFTEIPERTVRVETENSEGDQLELRFSASPADWWDMQFGYYYARRAVQTDVAVFTNVPTSNLVAKTTLSIPTGAEIDAYFTHNEFHIDESTSIILGLRYSKFDSAAANIAQTDLLIPASIAPGGVVLADNPAVITRGCPDGSAAPCKLGATDDVNKWTGTIKISHSFTDGLNGYASYDRGFRPGAPNFDTQGLIPPEIFTYEGESVDSVEFGLKGELWNGRAQWSAATFYSVYEDYQVLPSFSIFDPVRGTAVDIASVYVNADEVEQYGLEGEFRMLLTEYWSMFAAVAYNKVKFNEGTVPCNDASQPPLTSENPITRCEVAGEPAGEQPEWTFVLQSEYRAPFDAIGGDWFVNGLLNYNGDAKVPGDLDGRLTSNDYYLLDLNMGVGTEAWTAKVWMKNVFDDSEVIVRRTAGALYNDLTLVAPRTAGVTLSYQF